MLLQIIKKNKSKDNAVPVKHFYNSLLSSVLFYVINWNGKKEVVAKVKLMIK